MNTQTAAPTSATLDGMPAVRWVSTHEMKRPRTYHATESRARVYAHSLDFSAHRYPKRSAASLWFHLTQLFKTL